MILLNCTYLALDREIDVVTKNSNKIELCFLIIYIIEMVLKVIAMGFFSQKHSYLRDGWNILDFSVVIMGLVGLFFTDTNL